MKGTKAYITDFIGLDLLRFLLSVIVVINHYYFFYFRFVDVNAAIIKVQPFYNVLFLFYNWGFYAVHVFWLISGVIFNSIYYRELEHSEIGFGEFMFLRFSRLYPLHFVTFIAVAILQLFYFRTYGNFFIAQSQDVKHFILQLFYVASWYPDFKHSFNVPAWSVSVEIFVYVIFFLLAATKIIKDKGLILVIAFVIACHVFGILKPFSQCLVFFFSGCILGRLIDSGIGLKTLLLRYATLSAGLATLIVGIYFYYSSSYYQSRDLWIDFLLIPACSSLVLLFILLFRDVSSRGWIKGMKNLGNMTYSMYMVHFPIQLAMYLLLAPRDEHIFNNPLTLISFMAISIVTGWVAYEYFEKPVQKYLRIRFGTPRETLYAGNKV